MRATKGIIFRKMQLTEDRIGKEKKCPVHWWYPNSCQHPFIKKMVLDRLQLGPTLPCTVVWLKKLITEMAIVLASQSQAEAPHQQSCAQLLLVPSMTGHLGVITLLLAVKDHPHLVFPWCPCWLSQNLRFLMVHQQSTRNYLPCQLGMDFWALVYSPALALCVQMCELGIVGVPPHSHHCIEYTHGMLVQTAINHNGLSMALKNNIETVTNKYKL
jgi:hypothetical protein